MERVGQPIALPFVDIVTGWVREKVARSAAHVARPAWSTGFGVFSWHLFASALPGSCSFPRRLAHASVSAGGSQLVVGRRPERY